MHIAEPVSCHLSTTKKVAPVLAPLLLLLLLVEPAPRLSPRARSSAAVKERTAPGFVRGKQTRALLHHGKQKEKLSVFEERNNYGTGGKVHHIQCLLNEESSYCHNAMDPHRLS